MQCRQVNRQHARAPSTRKLDMSGLLRGSSSAFNHSFGGNPSQVWEKEETGGNLGVEIRRLRGRVLRKHESAASPGSVRQMGSSAIHSDVGNLLQTDIPAPALPDCPQQHRETLPLPPWGTRTTWSSCSGKSCRSPELLCTGSSSCQSISLCIRKPFTHERDYLVPPQGRRNALQTHLRHQNPQWNLFSNCQL